MSASCILISTVPIARPRSRAEYKPSMFHRMHWETQGYPPVSPGFRIAEQSDQARWSNHLTSTLAMAADEPHGVLREMNSLYGDTKQTLVIWGMPEGYTLMSAVLSSSPACSAPRLYHALISYITAVKSGPKPRRCIFQVSTLTNLKGNMPKFGGIKTWG